MDVQDDLALPTEVEQLVFRTAQEAVRNAGAHAGRGPRPDRRRAQQRAGARCGSATTAAASTRPTWPSGAAGGHLGLDVLRDLAESAGGTLQVTSAQGEGTTRELEVPAS